MKLGVSQSLYRAIFGQQLHPSRPSCPASRAPHHGQCLLAGPVDVEEVAGVEIVLFRAVPNVSAEFACWAQCSRESLSRTPSRSGRRWQAVAGRRRRWWASRRWELFKGRAGRAATSWTSSSVDVLGPCSDSVRFSSSTVVGYSCYSQRQAPTMQTVQFSVDILQVPLLDWLLTCPLLCNATCTVYGRHGRRHPCRPVCSEYHGDSPVAVHRSGVRRPCWASPEDSTCAVVEETAELHSCAVLLGQGRCHACCVQRQMPWCSVQKTARSRSCSALFKVADVPVAQVVMVPQILSAVIDVL